MLKKEKVLLFLSFLLLIFLTLVNYSCKLDTEVVGAGGTSNTNTKKSSIITGQVTNSQNIPLDSAYIQLYGPSTFITAVTDAQGKYSITLQLSNNSNFTLYTSKAGYILDTTAVFVTAGQNLVLNPIKLNTQSSTPGVVSSGDPVSIYLASQTAYSIGVKESGSPETAGLTFEVQDSSGIPIDLDHSVKVNFNIIVGPGGGEFLSPSQVNTNDKGQATVNLTSGTRAGVVQILAEIDLTSGTIKSQPVSIAIHGGLPDADHFSIAPKQLNFAGYNIYGLTDIITAFVGDKYGNPVKPQTVVYFTTTGGIIGGSTQTDASGTGSVTLMSASPQPNHPTLGYGFATITASTADENKNMISKDIIVLFSGIPQVTGITPSSGFDIPNGGSQGFDYTVSDQNMNPLAPGTQISVSVEGKNVGSQGDLSVTLPDTQSKTWTHFHFNVYDAADTTAEYNSVTITIKTNGTNGQGSAQISGHCR